MWRSSLWMRKVTLPRIMSGKEFHTVRLIVLLDAKGVGNTDTTVTEPQKKTLTVGSRLGRPPHCQTTDEHKVNHRVGNEVGTLGAHWRQNAQANALLGNRPREQDQRTSTHRQKRHQEQVQIHRSLIIIMPTLCS